MANGELLLSHINSIQLYTYQYLAYISTPAKYTVRDLDFKAGSARYIEVISNIDLTDEDKESVIASLNYINLSQLDLPVNYRAMLDAVVTIPKNNVHTRSDFEYAGVKLASAVNSLVSFFLNISMQPTGIVLTDIISDLGTGDLIMEKASLTAISNLLKDKSLAVKLSKVTGYASDFKSQFDLYIQEQLPQFLYLRNIYGQYGSDSFKPNSLPYIVIRS